MQQRLRVAIQGQEGCYHEMAAREYFKDCEVETVPCKSFQAEFDTMAADPRVLGVIAIENTIAGNLLGNHELLRQSQRQVIGEQRLHISHVLCCVPGQTMEDIVEVNSHPIALLQCEVFLQSQLPKSKIVEMADTAGSAKIIMDNKMMGHAAICSEYAANLYGMTLIEMDRMRVNKSSIEFCVRHTQGSLTKVLTILSFYDMNLTKIQSMPIIGHEWEYRFFVDMTFSDYMAYRNALDAIMPFTTDFMILGEYTENQMEIDV